MQRVQSDHKRYLLACIATAIIVVGGCSKPPTTANKPFVKIEQMSLEELKAFDEGTHFRDKNAVYMIDMQPKRPFPSGLVEDIWHFKVGLLRNPGGMLYIVKEHNSKTLTESDRSQLAKIALNAGVTILPDGRIPYRFGPDRVTPLVMPSLMSYEYYSDHDAKVVPMSAKLSFSDAKTAKSAAEYLDLKAFKPTIRGATLEVEFKAPLAAAIDEGDVFGRLARRFKGKYEYIDAGG